MSDIKLPAKKREISTKGAVNQARKQGFVPGVFYTKGSDPVTDRIMHIDLYGVTVGQTLQLQVPVQIVGSAKGVKEGGKLQVQLHKIDVECLPKDIPDHIEINVSDLALGDSIHAGSLNLENVKIITPEDVVIVTVAAPKAAAEEAGEGLEEGEESAEPEVIGKGKSEEEED